MKVYICTPLAEGKFNLPKISKAVLDAGAYAFIPPVGQLSDKTLGAKLDKLAIDQCDELWAFGPVGRDCCWEIGYAKGLGKVVKLFIDESNQYLVDEDWMVTIGAELVYDI